MNFCMCRVYCLYGIGVPTDRAFHYVKQPAASSQSASEEQAWGMPLHSGLEWVINSLVTDADSRLVSTQLHLAKDAKFKGKQKDHGCLKAPVHGPHAGVGCAVQ